MEVEKIMIGGDHYLDGVEPRKYANSHNFNYEQCHILSYLTRLGKKGDNKKTIEDINKIKHLCDLMLKDII
jgi:hypothetical protein